MVDTGALQNQFRQHLGREATPEELAHTQGASSDDDEDMNRNQRARHKAPGIRQRDPWQGR